MSKSSVLLFFLSLGLSLSISAQTIGNGSFSKSVCAFCAASPWEIGNSSPDISYPGRNWAFTTNYKFLNIIPHSPDGGTFANLGVDVTWNINEEIFQRVSGFQKGSEYFMSFYYINTGLRKIDNSVYYSDKGYIQVEVNGVPVFKTSPINPGDRWLQADFSFFAPDTNLIIEFVPMVDQVDALSNGAYMGLDGVQFISTLAHDDVKLELINDELVWTNLNEDKIDHYELERKSEADDAFVILAEKEVGSFSSNTYRVEDYLWDNSSKTYYRVKTITKKGDKYYSNLVQRYVEKQAIDLVVYPNPATPSSYISIQGAEEAGDLMIYNSMGELVKQVTSLVEQKLQLSELNVDLSQGVYYVEFSSLTQGKVTTRMVVK